MVSIIIPAYNAEKYIEETINSVLNQTYNDWELIIIDDGSTDTTKEKVHPFLKDKRVSYFYQVNGGVSAARNNGFDRSKGIYLAFLDADDVWLPKRLEIMVKKLAAEPILGLVHSYMQVINGNSIKQEFIYKGKEGKILDSLLLWDGCNIPAPSSILVKRKVLEQIGNFDVELSTAADQEFFFRVASRYSIGMCKEVLGLYRMHENNMHQNITRMEEDHLLAYKKAKASGFFKSWKFQQRCFSNLYIILAGSWWKDGNNKFKGIYFLLKAMITYPLNLAKILSKI